MSRTFSPTVDRGETYAELILLAEEGHDVPKSRLITAKRREALQQASQAEADQVAADLAAALQQAAEDKAAAREAARPGIAPLVAALADAKTDRDTKARALNEAKAAHAVAYSAANEAFQALHDYVSQNFGDDDPQATTSWQAVIIDGESYTR